METHSLHILSSIFRGNVQMYIRTQRTLAVGVSVFRMYIYYKI